jgi:Tfp pilus assembly protein PilP
MRLPVLTVALLMAFATVSLAQTKPAPAKPDAAPAPPAAPVEAATPADPAVAPAPEAAYTYSTDGRRDPFLNLLAAGAEPRATGQRGDGPTGLTVAEISVRGVVQSKGALVAMVQAPDNKTYIMRSGDKLMDGTIKAVTTQGLVIVQEINDPLSIEKQREVRKLLRSLEDAK